MTETRTEYTTKLCPQCKHPLKERRFTEDLEQVCLDCGHVFDEDEALQPDRLAMEGEEEQLRVQLAGCAVAAQGGISPDQVANPGDYGWSPAYQEVPDLRKRYEQLISEVRDLRLQVEQLADALEVVTQ